MRFTILLLFSFIMTCLLAFKAKGLVADPEVDFINTPDTVRAEFGISKKDEIIRLELDLIGDGKSTVFLTYKGTGSRGGANWTAYAPIDGGYARTDGIQFREDLVRAGKLDELNPRGGLLILYPGKGGGNLFHITFDDSGTLLIGEEVMQLDYSNPDHQQLYERIFGRKLGQPMSDEFFKNPPHKVVAVAEILARPQTSNSQKNPPPKVALPGSEVPEPVSKSQPPYKTSEIGQVSARTVSAPLASWPLIAAAIITAALLLWLLRKKYVGGRTK